MRPIALVLLVALTLGCTSPAPPPSSTTTVASTPGTTTATTPPTVTTTPTGPTTPTPLPPAVPGLAFDPVQWEEPAAPRADLISAAPAGEWTLHVVGKPGAAPAGTRLLVEALGNARGALGRAGADGSFAIDVTGSEGAWVHVATLPPQLQPGPSLLSETTKLEHLHPGTYVRASATPFAGLAAGERAVW